MGILNNKKAHVEYYDRVLVEEDSYKRVTHLGIGAHQDDLEIMASHGIVSCYDNPDKWFAGIICTDGSGSARTGEYKNLSDNQIKDLRFQEQLNAAESGQYSFVAQLGYTSSEVKCAEIQNVKDDIKKLILKSRPEIVYTHNIFDKHDTHVAVALRTIDAFRELPKENYPQKFYGCEVWRALDWLPEKYKVALDMSGSEELIQKLIACHKSQIAGGKRYDLATLGRMRANATYYESHNVDNARGLWFAIDLMPLLENHYLDITEYAKSILNDFFEDVGNKLSRYLEA